MITKPIKILLLAVISIIIVLVFMYAYRLLLMFNRAKVKALATTAASQYADANSAYQIIIESVENILKSPELVAQIKILAVSKHTDNETELVNMALNQCYSYGVFQRPNESTDGGPGTANLGYAANA